MKKTVRSKIYTHVDQCIKIMQELSIVWVATQKNSSLTVENQKNWNTKLNGLDNALGLIFEIFQKERKEIKYESVKDMLLGLIQNVTNFIKANKALKIENDTQLKVIGELVKELSFFEKKFEQHINVLV